MTKKRLARRVKADPVTKETPRSPYRFSGRAPGPPTSDAELAALLVESWGRWTFRTGVRAHVPRVNRRGHLESFAIVTPASLRALVKRLRARAKAEGR